MIIVRFPKRSKTQNSRFWCKIALHLKKVGYKVSLCENCQRQSCKAFIGLTIRAKMIGEGCLLLRENLAADASKIAFCFMVHTDHRNQSED